MDGETTTTQSLKMVNWEMERCANGYVYNTLVTVRRRRGASRRGVYALSFRNARRTRRPLAILFLLVFAVHLDVL